MKLIRKTNENNINPIKSKVDIHNNHKPTDISHNDKTFWKILIVDDEQDVHDVTKLSIKNLFFDGKKIQLLHAFSAKEANQILQQESNIAVALIDVVMETDHAGLELVKSIREKLNNHYIRLIIRTGQPGVAPEKYVIDEYDIDDYKEKTDLISQKLYTTIRCAIKGYRDINELQKANEFINEKVKILEGVLPICASCKKIRDDKGDWHQFESYISKHTSTEFTHGLCPTCSKKLYPKLS
ncbi:MAG: hypothetical protein HQK79_14490 [Desulfobacterales bacterium]|nr:hypothetical protein [Desulfobacterales bacterium]